MGSLFSKVFSRLFSQEEVRFLLVGLDSAGKTTILYRLRDNETYDTIPTIGFNVEELKFRNLNFTCYDVGGQDKIRPLWRHYFSRTEAIIFVIDSSDEARFPDAKAELHRMMEENDLADAVLLVLANKQDLPTAHTADEISQQLDLDSLRGHSWYIHGTCATKGEGLTDAFEWLTTQIEQRKRERRRR
ncbi:hypothetical protein GEMRC1_011352 [Eukaryota sp. GEM-RC1]